MVKEVYELFGRLDSSEGITCKCINNGEVKNEVNFIGGTDFFEVKTSTDIIRDAVVNKKTDKKIFIEHQIIGDEKIPTFFIFPENAKQLPTVIFMHGLTANKSVDINKGIMLAEEGFCTIVLDLRNHGERIEYDDNDPTEVKQDEESKKNRWLNVLLETSKDVLKIIDLTESDDRIDSERIGMSGVSMGGFITFTCITLDKRIKAAAPLVASPEWLSFSDVFWLGEYRDSETLEKVRLFEPLQNYIKIPPTPLLVQNSIEDSYVKIEGARELYSRLKPLYSEFPERYKSIEYPNLKHATNPEMIQNMIDWFKKYL